MVFFILNDTNIIWKITYVERVVCKIQWAIEGPSMSSNYGLSRSLNFGRIEQLKLHMPLNILFEEFFSYKCYM